MAHMKLPLGQIDADRPQLDDSSLPGISFQQPKNSNSVYCDRPRTTDWGKKTSTFSPDEKAQHQEDKLGEISHDNTKGLFFKAI